MQSMSATITCDRYGCNRDATYRLISQTPRTDFCQQIFVRQYAYVFNLRFLKRNMRAKNHVDIVVNKQQNIIS